MKKMFIDLHTHSSYSDGENTPNELIKKAKEIGITTLSITDHDTLNAYNNITIPEDIQIISGIELTAKVEKGRMHILGYNIDTNNKELNDKMKELENNSVYSIMSYFVQLKKDYNIIFPTEEIRNLLTAKHNLGRPDIAKLCLKYNYATSVQDAFDKYLIEAHNKIKKTRKGIPYPECIKLINNSGGIAVLAHPNSLELTNEELEKLIQDMIKEGLQGIEIYHNTYTKEEHEFYKYLSEKYNLVTTGGTDYHGPLVKPEVELGYGRNKNIYIEDLTILKEL